MQHLKVKVYTSPGCPYCSKAKSYLRSFGIRFTEIDISRKPQEAEKLVRKTGQTGVPVIEVGNQIVIGFDKQKLDRILGV